MELPTYTSIWRIEKRLYKLYDFRLPMPVPVGQIAVFAAITLPYVILLTVLGLPFNHTLFWLYVLPPGVLTWLATRPVLESKRLPELVISQVRYLQEPGTWCRMNPLAEKDDVVVVGKVWRRAEQPEPAAAPAPTPARQPAPAPARAPATARRPAAAPARAAAAQVPATRPVAFGQPGATGRRTARPPVTPGTPGKTQRRVRAPESPRAARQLWEQARTTAAPPTAPAEPGSRAWPGEAARPGPAGVVSRARPAPEAPVNPASARPRWPDVAPEPVPDVASRPVPDVASKPVPDVAPESAPDVALEPAPDVAPEPAPGAAAHGPAEARRAVGEAAPADPVPTPSAPDPKPSWFRAVVRRPLPSTPAPPPVAEESRPEVPEPAGPTPPTAQPTAQPAGPLAPTPDDELEAVPGRSEPVPAEAALAIAVPAWPATSGGADDAAARGSDTPAEATSVDAVAGPPSSAVTPQIEDAPAADQAVADQAVADQAAYGPAAPDQAALDQAAPAQTVADQSRPAEPLPGQAASAQPAPIEAAPAEDETPAEDAPAGNAPAESTLADDSPAGHTPGEDSPATTVKPPPPAPGAPPAGDAPAPAPTPGRPAAEPHVPGPRTPPVVIVRGNSPRPTMVERAIGGPGQHRGGASWREHVRVVPGGHGPGRPDLGQRDRARTLLPIPEPRLAVVLGCTVGAGQTVTTLMIAEVLASLRSDPVATLDLNPGQSSLASLTDAVPAATVRSLLAGQATGARPGRRRGYPDLIAHDTAAAGEGLSDPDYARLVQILTSRYPLTLADPGPSAVTRLLAAADQLVLVAPASSEAARAVAMTMEWLDGHGHADLCAGSIAVINGVSKRSISSAEQAELVIRGRCRTIVRVPWDDHLAEAPPAPGTRSGRTAGPDSWFGQLRPPVQDAYTALAGVVVSALTNAGTAVGSEQRRVSR